MFEKTEINEKVAGDGPLKTLQDIQCHFTYALITESITWGYPEELDYELKL